MLIIISIATKSIPWKAISKNEVLRYQTLLNTFVTFYNQCGLGDYTFDEFRLSHSELNEFDREGASQIFEANMLRLTTEILTVLKTLNQQLGYWFETRLADQKLIFYHGVVWKGGIPKIDRRLRTSIPLTSPYYEDALVAAIMVYNNVLQKQHEQAA